MPLLKLNDHNRGERHSDTHMKTWLFWDWCQIEHQDNAEIRMGRPQWVPEGTYEDANFDYLGFKPRVYRDEVAGLWRMLYIGSGFPLVVLGAKSVDGVKWQPLDRPDIDPGGPKLAPNHLFTIERANGPVVYLDPVARDGNRFRFFFSHRGGMAAAGASQDRSSPFHEILQGDGIKPYFGNNRTATSEDGLHWEVHETAFFDRSGWFPEGPFNAFFNHKTGKHVMVTRPGWGDRRLVGMTSQDGLQWGAPYHLMQADLEDPPQTQLYGMPVTRYGDGFVGFLWMAHFSNAERLRRWNQLFGYCDCQLTWSPDGRYFQRVKRETFLPLNEMGLPGSGVIWPVSLVDRGEDLFIYSVGTPDMHHQYTQNQAVKKGETPGSAVLLHRLRKDGFTYLCSRGNWATVISKPLLLQAPDLAMNALAPHGEVYFQLTDVLSEPIPGYTFEESVPFAEADARSFPIRWREKTLDDLVDRKVVRLELKFRHARIFSFHGNLHFTDALDIALVEDGQSIDTTQFDY